MLTFSLNMNILIIKPSSLGDIVHAFPAVQLLRKEHPEAHITWMVNESFAGIVDLISDVDELLIFKRKRWGKLRHFHELIGFIHELRKRNYDLVIDFQGLLRTGIFTFLSRSKKKIGFNNAREGARYFYHDKVLIPANLTHAVDKNLFLIQSSLHISTDDNMPKMMIQPDAIKAVKRLHKEHNFTNDKPTIAIAPAARWKSKTWAPSFFAKVIDIVNESIPEFNCWILGTEEEFAIGEKVKDKSSFKGISNLMGGTNFGTLVQMLRQSDVLLTNDSGPMHIGASLQLPTIALFGPTDPNKTGPYGEIHKVFCGECEQSPCFLRTCPLNKQICTTTIAAQDVAEAIINIIKEKQNEQDN